MNCLVCRGGTMIESFEPYFAKLKSGYLIIENVPCFKCEQCGEILFSMSVLERIEELIVVYENISDKVSVIDYQKAA